MFAKLQNKVKNLEVKFEILSEQKAKHLDCTTKVEKKFESYFLEAERTKITSKAYSKRLNILVHGIEEHPTNPGKLEKNHGLNSIKFYQMVFAWIITKIFKWLTYTGCRRDRYTKTATR